MENTIIFLLVTKVGRGLIYGCIYKQYKDSLYEV